MIRVVRIKGVWCVAARALHREIENRAKYEDWLQSRLRETQGIEGMHYRTMFIGRTNVTHLSPAFAQELALWERTAVARDVAREISKQAGRVQLSGKRADLIIVDEIEEALRAAANKPDVEIVAPIPTAELVIKGLNDPAILRAVLFHYIELNDQRETAKRGK